MISGTFPKIFTRKQVILYRGIILKIWSTFPDRPQATSHKTTLKNHGSLCHATCVSGAMGNSMCTIWLMFLSLGALGVLGGSYLCSSYGTANPFSSLVLSLAHPFRTLCSVQWLAESVPVYICHVLAESRRWQLYPAPSASYDYFIATTNWDSSFSLRPSFLFSIIESVVKIKRCSEYPWSIGTRDNFLNRTLIMPSSGGAHL